MKFRIWLLFLMINLSLFGQRGLIQYSKENGLISNEVRDVEYDHNGFIWLATPKGIERFDGQRFIHFKYDPQDSLGISSNDIQSVVFDGDKTIWATTFNKGLISIQTEKFNIINYNKKYFQSFGSNRIQAIACRDGFVWCVSENGTLLKFNPKNRKSDLFVFSTVKTPDFNSLFFDEIETNKLWLTSSDGLFSFDLITNKWKKYRFKKSTCIHPKLNGRYTNKMTCLTQDSKGNFYVGLNSGGLLYFNQYQGLFKSIRIKIVDLNYEKISSIAWRDSRYLYLCFENREILLFDTKTKEYVRYEESERSTVLPYRIAKMGSQLAVSSSVSGLFIHDESLIYGKKLKPSMKLIQVKYSKKGRSGYQLLGTSNPVLKKIKGVGPTQITLNGLMDTKTFYYLKNGGILVVGGNGMILLDSDLKISRKMLISSYQSIDKRVQNSLLVGDSLLFVGTLDASLIRISLKTFTQTIVYKANQEEPSNVSKENFPLSLVGYKEFVFFSENDQLYRYHVYSKKLDKIRLFTHENADQITCLTICKYHKLWIGTKASGVWSYNLKKATLVNTYNSLNGLKNDDIIQLIVDSESKLWIMNPSSIAIVNPILKTIKCLEKRNGIEGVQTMTITPDSIYFLQGDSYIVSSSAEKLPIPKLAIPYILQIREMNGNARFTSQKSKYMYNQNNLVFEFGVKDFSNSENIRVNYRMLGLDNRWINGTQKNEALYHNLPSGKYIFQVQVIDGFDVRMTSYSFKITKPFWLRWWFLVLSSLAVGFGIWYYMRTRIKRIQSTEQMKSEFSLQINELESKALRAQMNPHFLFNSLNSIRLFILKNEVDNAADYIAKFSKLLRMILNHSRQDMITVYDEIQSLKLYLEFERLRFDQDFDFDLQIDGQEVLDCQIPPMIIQPFIENAIWHGLMPRTAGGGKIRVSFQKQLSGLYVMVQDNGIGREKAKENNRKRSLKEGSVGLQITKDRLKSLTMRTKKMNEFEIEDLIDENGLAIGTLVTLYFETSN
ncbi:sensor histidine kinase [Fluviicola taffensis]|uniref:Signal transduction histidine kinase, LytS n=1 Tax=Fluviicola taffensis (strain DSM 16823 / NCIMB 13979 / RW262) TaxID=755732 RepID=F2IAE6_FLUTR|nr:histidine kinase [Fluviicola taffensis]AEA42081.1 signal transduction histidine kinase, LytS [Fluviicola taffensis DSM 16823]